MNTPQKKSVIVIGSGLAGMVVASRLAEKGYSIVVIEKSSKRGGHAIELNCKATTQCNQCNLCLMKEENVSLSDMHLVIP